MPGGRVLPLHTGVLVSSSSSSPQIVRDSLETSASISSFSTWLGEGPQTLGRMPVEAQAGEDSLPAGGCSPTLLLTCPQRDVSLRLSLALITVQASRRSLFLSSGPKRRPRLAQRQLTMHTARKYEHKTTRSGTKELEHQNLQAPPLPTITWRASVPLATIGLS